MIVNSKNILTELWDAAADNLDNQQLEFMSGAIQMVGCEMGNLSSVLMSLGCLVNCEDAGFKGEFADNETLSSLLFSISHQVDTLNGFLNVASSATDRLLKPDFYQRCNDLKAAEPTKPPKTRYGTAKPIPNKAEG